MALGLLFMLLTMSGMRCLSSGGKLEKSGWLGLVGLGAGGEGGVVVTVGPTGSVADGVGVAGVGLGSAGAGALGSRGGLGCGSRAMGLLGGLLAGPLTYGMR